MSKVADEGSDLCVGINALGVDLDLVATTAELAIAIREAWHDALSTEPRAAAVSITATLASADGADDADVRGTDAAEVLHHLSPIVTQRAIEARVGDLLMLHAAALADPTTGATAILVAPSGTGKTTASRRLGKTFAYLSDETAGLERDGRVVPYRKPLSIIEGGWVKTQLAPSALGLLDTDLECRLAAVLLLERSPDHGDEPTVTPLHTIDAIAAVTTEASYLARTEKPLHRIAEMLHLAGGAHRVTYREAETLEPVLHDLLASRT